MSDTVDTLKQRVVGAFVIISLAVIFLPMIFDEPRVAQSNLIVPVPPAPAYKVIEIEKPREPKLNKLTVDPDNQKIVVKQNHISPIPPSSYDLLNHSKTTGKNLAENKEKISNLIPSEATDAVINQDNSSSVSDLPVFKNVWMIQLGVFSNTENAYKLRDNLRKDGFDGHTKHIDLDGKPAIRVFTGPFVDKREAEKIKPQLDKKYDLKSKVLFFDA